MFRLRRFSDRSQRACRSCESTPSKTLRKESSRRLLRISPFPRRT